MLYFPFFAIFFLIKKAIFQQQITISPQTFPVNRVIQSSTSYSIKFPINVI